MDPSKTGLVSTTATAPPMNEPPPPYTANYGATDNLQPGVGGGYPPPGTEPKPPPGGYPSPGGYPPPAGGYQPPPPATTTAIITTQPVAPSIVKIGPTPIHCTCTRCHANVITTISYSDGTLVWLAAIGICLVGGWFGCCLIPFCLNSAKDVTHACPNCGYIFGVYRRL